MKRILVITDIHGCYSKFIDLLTLVNYNSNEDKLILLGDYVDRGPYPMKTLLFVGELVEKGAIALLGNHDAMFKELVDNKCLYKGISDEYYISLGENITTKNFYKLSSADKDKVKKILNNLKLYYEFGDYIFSHAGVNASVELKYNNEDDFTWSREKFFNHKAYPNKICIFGHTPTPLLHNNNFNFNIWHDNEYHDKIGIDCGCVFQGGKLACLELPTMKEYYI